MAAGPIPQVLFNADARFPTILVSFLEGGSIYRICHFAFIGAIVFAVVVIAKRQPRPWCLIASALPLLVAGFAYHFRWLMLFNSATPRAFDSARIMFIYDVRFFWWGLITWIVLSSLSLGFGRPVAQSSVQNLPTR